MERSQIDGLQEEPSAIKEKEDVAATNCLNELQHREGCINPAGESRHEKIKDANVVEIEMDEITPIKRKLSIFNKQHVTSYEVDAYDSIRELKKIREEAASMATIKPLTGDYEDAADSRSEDDVSIIDSKKVIEHFENYKKNVQVMRMKPRKNTVRARVKSNVNVEHFLYFCIIVSFAVIFTLIFWIL